VDALIAFYHYEGASLVGENGIPPGEMSALESAYSDYMHTHSEYLGSEPAFDTTNTRAAFPDLPCPPVDGPLLAKLLAYAADDQYGRRRK
jgi:hypothetical protein